MVYGSIGANSLAATRTFVFVAAACLVVFVAADSWEVAPRAGSGDGL